MTPCLVEEGAESGAQLDGMTTLSLTMLSVDDLESIEETLFWMPQPWSVDLRRWATRREPGASWQVVAGRSGRPSQQRLPMVVKLVLHVAVVVCLNWFHQRKEVVHHMIDCSHGTLEVVGR